MNIYQSSPQNVSVFAGPSGASTGDATDAAPGGWEAASRRFAVSRFAALLNMASPESPSGGRGLIPPHGLLALQAGRTDGGGRQPVSYTPPKPGPVDTSPEALAQGMLDALGDGKVIRLSDAQRELAIPEGMPLSNDPARVREAYGRLDRDRSGSLDHGELTQLMRSYQQQRNRGVARPTLPSNWA